MKAFRWMTGEQPLHVAEHQEGPPGCLMGSLLQMISWLPPEKHWAFGLQYVCAFVSTSAAHMRIKCKRILQILTCEESNGFIQVSVSKLTQLVTSASSRLILHASISGCCTFDEDMCVSSRIMRTLVLRYSAERKYFASAAGRRLNPVVPPGVLVSRFTVSSTTCIEYT